MMRRLATKCEKAKPNRFFTLTLWTKAFLGGQDAWNRTRRKVPELIRRIRKTHGPIEYMKVLESTAKGFPHWHFIARGPYIPQQWLSDQWNDLAQSPIVDIQRPDKIRSTYAYVVKYLGKQHIVPWTKRRISWSKHFFVPEPKPPSPVGQVIGRKRSHMHPDSFASCFFYGEELTQLTPTCWVSATGGFSMAEYARRDRIK